MQVGLHSEPHNIWLDTGTRQPDISPLHREPCSVCPPGQAASGGLPYADFMLSILSFARHILSLLYYLKRSPRFSV